MKRWLAVIALAAFLLNVDLALLKWKSHQRSETAHSAPVTQAPTKPSEPLSEPLPLDTPIKPDLVIHFVEVAQHRQSEQGTVYGDILSHSQGAPFGDHAGRTTNAHETTHGINSEIRNSHQQQGKKINGFYVLQGRGVVIEEPKIKMSDAVKFVPQSLHSYRWHLYMEQQIRSWNDTPTYICDEWVAYINGGACGVDDVKRGKHRDGWTDGVSGCCDFSIYTIALAMATKEHCPDYWRDYPQFRNFIIWELRVAERIFKEGRVMDQFKWKKQDDLLLTFLEKPEAEAMRKFCREELQGVWLDFDPAKIRATDYTGTPTNAEDIATERLYTGFHH